MAGSVSGDGLLLKAGVESPREHQDAVGRQHKCSRVAEIVQGKRLSKDATAIACNTWIDPILIDIAVKDFTPVAATRESDAVAETIEVRQVHHHDHIMPFTHHPPVEGERAVLIVAVHHAKPLPT